jgi:hypothetical protein
MKEKYVVVAKKGQIATVLVVGNKTFCEKYIEKNTSLSQTHDEINIHPFDEYCEESN